MVSELSRSRKQHRLHFGVLMYCKIQSESKKIQISRPGRRLLLCISNQANYDLFVDVAATYAFSSAYTNAHNLE